MSSCVSRGSAYVAAVFFCLFITVLLWTGCGGTSQSSSSNSSAANNPPASGSQPGNTSSGSGGSSGTGNGNTGGSGAAYLYVGVDNTSAAIRGYKIDANAASLTEVPGSPFALQGGSPGVVAVSKSFVYGSEMANGSDVVPEFRADAGSGTLSQIGTLTLPFTSEAGIFPEPSGHNLYAVFGDILTLDINPDGTLTNTGSRVHIADNVGDLVVSPNGQLAYATIGNGSFKAGTQTDGLFVLNRDQSSGMLTPNHQVNSNQHLYGLQFDTSRRYLLAVSGAANQISVYSVDYSTGNATPVAGSPFTVIRGSSNNSPDFTRTFRLDPSGKFVYALNANLADPRYEYVSVFSFSEATGTLAPLQTMDVMAASINPTSLVVDQSLVIVINSQSGFNPSNITVFRRDANTGMLNAGGSPVTLKDAVDQANEMHF